MRWTESQPSLTLFKYLTRFPTTTGHLDRLSTVLLYLYLSLTLFPSVSSPQWGGRYKGHICRLPKLKVPLICERERVVVERTTHPSFVFRIRVSGDPPDPRRTVVEMLNCITNVGNKRWPKLWSQRWHNNSDSWIWVKSDTEPCYERGIRHG